MVRSPIYLGELGLIGAVVGNAGLSSFLLLDAPWWLLFTCMVLALGGIAAGAWALVHEDTSPARMWERAARKAERRAAWYASKGMPTHAKYQLEAAGVARNRARIVTELQAPYGARKTKGTNG